MTIDGFIGKPVISRGNRNFENYYVNGRYVRSKLLARAIEDGYQTSMMQHKYPFTLFYVQMDGEAVDVNVHPTKMELRFSHQEEIYRQMRDMISDALNHREQIVKVSLSSDRERKAEEKAARKEQIVVPEPFEQKRQVKALHGSPFRWSRFPARAEECQFSRRWNEMDTAQRKHMCRFSR